MLLWKTILIAFGLGADAMSVSAAIGVRWHGARQKFRLAWHMGLFQFIMPLIGWYIGSELAKFIHAWGKWVAAALVFGIGAKMLIETIRSGKEKNDTKDEKLKIGDPTKGWSLVGLSVATSIDALLVGMSLGLGTNPSEHPIWTSSLIIGLVAAAMSLAGVFIGQYLGKAFGRIAEFAGAIVLMGLGVSFVIF